MSGAMRNKVQRKFKMRGYTLKVEALSGILSFVSRFPEAEDEALDLLLDELHHSSRKIFTFKLFYRTWIFELLYILTKFDFAQTVCLELILCCSEVFDTG